MLKEALRGAECGGEDNYDLFHSITSRALRMMGQGGDGGGVGGLPQLT